MITGTIARDGTVVVTWNIQEDKLLAFDSRGEMVQLLPCEVCGKVVECSTRTVSVVCETCAVDFGVEQAVKA